MIMAEQGNSSYLYR